MHKYALRLPIVGFACAAAVFAASCTDAPGSPDVSEMSELPGDTGKRTYGAAAGTPSIECLSPPNRHTLPARVMGDGQQAAVPVGITWTSNVGDALRAGTYRLTWFDNGGEPLGAQNTLDPIQVPLEYGEHLVTLALTTPDGALLESPSARCSLQIRVTRQCETDRDCADSFDCNTNRCAASGGGAKTCEFLPDPRPSCCQQSFQCAFGRHCNAQRSTCVACLADDHCDDGNSCTTDSCNGGICTATTADATCCDCAAGGAGATQCDDGNACTTSSCNCGTGRCNSLPVRLEDGAVCCTDTMGCDDGLVDTTDLCAANVCRHVPSVDAATALVVPHAVDAARIPVVQPSCFDQAEGCVTSRPVAGATVRLSPASGVIAGPLIDHGDGTYSRVVHGLDQANSATEVAVQVSGQDRDSVRLLVGGGPAAEVDVVFSIAQVWLDDATVQAFVHVVDSTGRAVTAGTEVTLRLTARTQHDNAAVETPAGSARCLTNATGRCTAEFTVDPRWIRANAAAIAVQAEVGALSLPVGQLEIQPVRAAAVEAAGLILQTPEAPLRAGEVQDVTLYANTSGKRLGAFDVALALTGPATVTAVLPAAGVEAPVWHVLDGTLRINGLSLTGLVGTRVPLATVQLTGSTDVVLGTDAGVTVTSAQLLTAQLLRLPTSLPSAVLLGRKPRGSAAATAEPVTAPAHIDLADVQDIRVRLSDSRLESIADHPRAALQTARVTVLGTLDGLELDLTPMVTIVPQRGLAFDSERGVLIGKRAGIRTFSVQSQAGDRLATGTIEVAPRAQARIRALQVVAPCSVTPLGLDQMIRPEQGRALAAVAVRASIETRGTVCPLEVIAHFEDGTSMALTGDPAVVLAATDPTVLRVVESGVAGVGTGSARVRATLLKRGRTVATGSAEIGVDLASLTSIEVEPATLKLAVATGNAAATVRGLSTRQTPKLTLHFADGTTAPLDDPSVAKWSVSGFDGVRALDGTVLSRATGPGVATVTVSVAGHTAEIAVEVVTATELVATLNEPFTPELPAMADRSLGRIEGTEAWQQALLVAELEFSDGVSLDVTGLRGFAVQAVRPGANGHVTSVVAWDSATRRISGVGPGTVDLLVSAAGQRTRVEAVQVTEQRLDIVSLVAAGLPETLEGIAGEVALQLNVWATLSDGTRTALSHKDHIHGLLTFVSSVPSAAEVSETGALRPRGNQSTILEVTVSSDADSGQTFQAPVQLPVDVNLTPAVGDLDLGDSSGLSLKDRQPGDVFELEARFETGETGLGAFDVALTYDPEVVRITGVRASPALGGGTFAFNADGEPGVVRVNGSVSPAASPQVGTVLAFTLMLQATKGGDGISDMGGQILSLVGSDAVTAIGPATPRFMIAGAGAFDPNCPGDKVLGDANDNCVFGAEDGLFIQRHLAGLEAPTAVQLDKMDAYPDNSVSIADALFLSQVLAKLTYFTQVKVDTPTAGNTAALVVTLTDRDQLKVSTGAKVQVEVWTSGSIGDVTLSQSAGAGTDATTLLGDTTSEGSGAYRVQLGGINTGTVRVGVLVSSLKPDATALKTIAFLGSQEIPGGTFSHLLEFTLPLSNSDACFSDADCDVTAYCDDTTGPGAAVPTNKCQPKKDDGNACPKPTACKTDHCQNDLCCASGDCCDVVGVCPASYTVAPACQDASNCQGTRSDPTCVSNVCGSTPANDDSGCDGQPSDTCGCYNSVSCSADVTQAAVACPTTCTADGECDASCHCDGTCEADVPNGGGCDEASDCVSGYCDGGVCCDGPSGTCCNSDGACGALDVAATCDDATTCQGS
ncbi:MAG: hypothetical protein ACI9WU_000908, partial [Myxococcota bacterium]